jgi:hypothetical protein
LEKQIADKEEFLSSIVQEADETEEALRRKQNEKEKQLAEIEKVEERTTTEIRQLILEASKMEER